LHKISINFDNSDFDKLSQLSAAIGIDVDELLKVNAINTLLKLDENYMPIVDPHHFNIKKEEENLHLVNKVLETLKEYAIKQEDIAKYFKISRSAVSKAKKGEKNKCYETIIANKNNRILLVNKIYYNSLLDKIENTQKNLDFSDTLIKAIGDTSKNIFIEREYDILELFINYILFQIFKTGELVNIEEINLKDLLKSLHEIHSLAFLNSPYALNSEFEKLAKKYFKIIPINI